MANFHLEVPLFRLWLLIAPPISEIAPSLVGDIASAGHNLSKTVKTDQIRPLEPEIWSIPYMVPFHSTPHICSPMLADTFLDKYSSRPTFFHFDYVFHTFHTISDFLAKKNFFGPDHSNSTMVWFWFAPNLVHLGLATYMKIAMLRKKKNFFQKILDSYSTMLYGPQNVWKVIGLSQIFT